MFFFSLFKQNLTISEILVIALALIIAAVSAIVFHELAHGYVALKFGDYTAKSRGRLTLNPVSHFDLIGLLMLLIAGFGWAKPVPIDSRNFSNYKKGMISVSLAGVVTNLIIAGFALFLFYLLLPFINVINPMDIALVNVLKQFVFYLLLYMIQINFMLALFNILPIYPLDGYNLVNTLLKPGNKFSQFMRQYGFYCLLGLIIGGRLFSMIGLDFLNIFDQFGKLILKMINAVIGARLG